MERESTIYIIALYLKHTDFIRAKRQTNVPLKNAQFYSLVGAVLGWQCPFQQVWPPSPAPNFKYAFTVWGRARDVLQPCAL